MSASFFTFAFNGFALDPTNGIFIDKNAVKPGWKQAMVEVEGAAGGYIGQGFDGLAYITMSGLIKGASGVDLRIKQRALLAALRPGTSAVLTLDDMTSFPEAVCQDLPTFTDTTDMLFASTFAVVFIAQPET